MRLVDQTLTLEKDGNGNCWSACLATLLDVPLERVPAILHEETEPDPVMGDMQVYRTQHWLAMKGFGLDWRDLRNPFVPMVPMIVVHIPVILCGPSPRDRFQSHAVIGRVTGELDDAKRVKYEVLHDPHPSRDGILSLSTFYWITMVWTGRML